jgi:acetolactate synthase-1/2/3 large subunit
MRGAKVAMEVLKELKVDVMFGHPGGACLPLYDEIYSSGIRHILVRHEQCAAHMADGYARVKKRPGVAVATSGPGATNLVTGIATAYMDSSPVVAITGQVSTAVMGNDAFQEVDAFGIMMPCTKHNYRIMKPDEIPRVFRDAFRVALDGRYGPVHVDFPVDCQNGEVSEEALAERPENGKPPKRDLSRLLDAIKFIEEAEEPVILVGGGARWSGAGQEILQLAEMIQAPVVTTLMGKGSVPEDHPLVLGPVGMHGKMVATHVLNNCDLVIALGSRFSDRSTGKWSEFGKERQTRIIHVDIDASELGKNLPYVAGLVSDVWTAVNALISGLQVRARNDRSSWMERVKLLKQECACQYNYAADPIIKPQRIIWELNRWLPDDAIVTTEVGRNQMWAEHFLEVRKKRMFLTSGGLGTMGFGFPAALGAKIAAPDRTVVDVAGDGSMQMTIQEMATASEENIPITVVVMNDQSLGMVEQWQRMFYEERYCAVKLGRIPDFVKIAEAYRWESVRVERDSEMAEAFRAAGEIDTPYLIDVIIDPREDMLPIMPPGKTAKDVILGPRCIWKGGKGVVGHVPARA